MTINEVLSNTSNNTDLHTLAQADNVWTFIAVNVNRDAGIAEIFFNGVSQGAYDVSALTGIIYPTQYFQIGAINNGGGPAGIQHSGLDDLAFYEGTLSPGQIAALSAGAIGPGQIVSPSGLRITSVSIDRGTGGNKKVCAGMG